MTSFAAINQDTEWDVRVSGAADNGSGFANLDPGTSVDYSTQDAAQLSLADFATAGIGNTTLTTATGGFTAAMAGNVIFLDNGTNLTNGYYQITVYTDTNTVTLDRAPDNGVGAMSAGDGKVGGATTHPQYLIDYADMAGGNIIYIKDGNYFKLGGDGSIIEPDFSCSPNCSIRGYKTSQGDFPVGADRPNLDCEAGGIDCINVIDDGWTFYNLIVENGGDDCVSTNSTGDNPVFYNVRLTSCVDMCSVGNDNSFWIGCEMDNCGDNAWLTASSQDIILWDSYIHDFTSVGFESTQSSAYFRVIDSIIESGTGDGILGSANCDAYFIKNSIFYNNTGAASDGIEFDEECGSTFYPHLFINNSFVSNGQHAVNMDISTAKTDFTFDFNNYFGHATELDGVVAGPNDTGDDDPEFTDAGGGDFTVGATSPLLDAALSVETVTTVTGAYNKNIAVDQDDNTAGGGCTNAFGVIQ